MEKDFGDENFFVCPKCGHRWEDTDIEPPDRGSETTTCCPECDEEISVSIEYSWWSVQDSSDFAAKYLNRRGYARSKEDPSWYQLGCYLERFLSGNTDKPAAWNYPDWDKAFDIVNKYFGTPPLTIVLDILNEPHPKDQEGNVYLVGEEPAGEFKGHAGEFAKLSYVWHDGRRWHFEEPVEGHRCEVVGGRRLTYTDEIWTPEE